MNFFKRWLGMASMIGAAVLLASCGGGGGEAGSPNPKGFTKIVSFGDSLSDAGTYAVGTVAALGGGRYTINSGSLTAPAKIWLDLLSQQLGLPAPCPAVQGLQSRAPFGAPVARTTVAGCDNYAQGGARVTNPIGPANAALPDASGGFVGQLTEPVATQISNYLAANSNRFATTTLVTVLAGGNDIFMNGGAVAASLMTPQDAVAAMAQAGTELATQITTNIIGNGAKRVVVVNLPDVSSTPYGLASGTTTAAFVNQMVQAFNATLQAGLAGRPEVLLVDAYTSSRDQFLNPANYGLSNVTNRACKRLPENVLNGASIVCNVNNTIAGDVSRYAFADDVHPTPYGHQLLGQLVARAMQIAGWL